MRSLFCTLLTLLAVLSFKTRGLAQTAPDWISARTVGNGYPGPSKFVVDASGNTYVAGGFIDSIAVGGTVLHSRGYMDGYIAKYTPDGIIAWYKQLGSVDAEQVNGIAVDAAGNIYVAGVFNSSISVGNQLSIDGGITNQAKLFVIRYSPSGTPVWVQQSKPDATGFVSAVGGSIATDAAGQVYVAGYFDNAVTIGSVSTTTALNKRATYLARFSATSGAVQSLTTAFSYLASANASSYSVPLLAVTASGEAYVLNSFTADVIVGTTTLTNRGSIDGLVAKYNAQGRLEWVQQFGGSGDDWVSGCAVDAGGNLYATVAFNAAITFGATTLPVAGQFDGGLVKYSPQGALQWVQSGGGSGYDRYNGISLDYVGNPFVVGYFEHVAQFGGLTLTSAGNLDVMVVAYTPGGQVRWAQQAGGFDADVGDLLGVDLRGDIYVLGSFFRAADFGSIQVGTSSYNHFSNCQFVGRLGNSTQTPQPTSGLYPNPATELVNMPGISVGSRVQFFDAVGRLVREASTSAINQVSVQGLAPGLYILLTTTTTGQRYTGKLSVQ